MDADGFLIAEGSNEEGTVRYCTWGRLSDRRTGRKVDHVLVAAGAATIREASIVYTNDGGRYPSDHFPVTAVVEWP